MATVLLINPKDSELRWSFKVPWSTLHVGSYLKSFGHKITLLDPDTSPDFEMRFRECVQKADLAGFSLMTCQVHYALPLMQFIRKNYPALPVVVRGIHPTLLPEQTCSSGLIHYVVVGEGEKTVLKLVEHLGTQGSLKDIDGLVWKQNGSVIRNREREVVNLDDLPFLDYDLLERQILHFFSTSTLSIFTGKGCSFRCAFCVNQVLGQRFRGKSAARVLDEIDYCLKRFHSKDIYFRDDNFFHLRKRVVEILEGILRRGYQFTWRAACRVGYFNDRFLNDEMLSLLKRSGCLELKFGAESGSQRVLDYISKDITIEQTVRAAEKCRQFGFRGNFSFITALPTETREEALQTLNLIDRIKKIVPWSVIVGPQPFRPYPGGRLYEDCVKEGLRLPSSFEEWGEFSQNILTNSHLPTSCLPWIKDPDYVECIWTIAANAHKNIWQLLKNPRTCWQVIYVLPFKLRWRYRFFRFPYEVKVLSFIRKWLLLLKSRLLSSWQTGEADV
jgi:radical SAM superfamily enzyme YgiQ (UPF0313 family)